MPPSVYGNIDAGNKMPDACPDRERHFISSGLLCEWNEDGTSRVLQYVGHESVVCLPESTVSIEPCAFAGAHGIRELHLNAGLARVGMGALSTRECIEMICLELSEPICGQTWAKARFPYGEWGKIAVAVELREDIVDPELLLYCSDRAMILYEVDFFRRASWALDRLKNAMFLDGGNRSCCEELLSRNVPKICESFAQKGYTKGFDLLADLLLLNGDNITGIIERISDAGHVAATSYLLEMKRRRFGGAMLNLRF